MPKRLGKFELPSKLTKVDDVSTATYGKFIAEPFEAGYGHTVGNSLRRILLSSIEGTAISSIKIDGVNHEFQSIDGVVEDVTDIVLNLKKILFVSEKREPFRLHLKVNKEGAVTAGDIQLDAGVKIVNPDQLICTLDHKRTFGYYRFEILAAAFNAVVLFLVAAYILYEAYQRFRSPPEIQSLGMLVIALLGLVINLVGMRMLQAGSQSSLNVKGAYLEVWADMLGSLGVIFAALVIYFTGWAWVDAVVAALIGVWVLPRTWKLLKESLNILLEGVPVDIALDEIEQAVLAVPGVREIHDLHVWALTSGKNSLSVHVVLAEGAEEQSVLAAVTKTLAERFSMRHVTVQIEAAACDMKDLHGGRHFPSDSHDHN